MIHNFQELLDTWFKVPGKPEYHWTYYKGTDKSQAHIHFMLGLVKSLVQFSSVQSLSSVLLSATPWIATCQASPSITNPWSLLKLMPI